MPKQKGRRGARGQELVGFTAAGTLGYLTAESLLRRFVHPLHWLTAALAGMVGYGAVLAWFRQRQPHGRA